MQFRLTGGLATTDVHIWETNNSRTFEHVADVKPEGASFEYTFDPDSLYSLTTTTGQAKGMAQPPAAKPFPLPYADDFEKTSPGHTPKYLSDQDGAFEVHPCKGRPGQCLEQVITEKPIPWDPLPDPFTLAGDEAWTDYRVFADVHFVSDAPAVVMGRIDSSNVFTDDKARWPSGYVLRVHTDGTWELLSTEYKKPAVTLASDQRRSIAINGTGWNWASAERKLRPRSMASLFQRLRTQCMRTACSVWERNGTTSSLITCACRNDLSRWSKCNHRA